MRGGYPNLGHFLGFWALPVKTVCPTCLPGSASQQRERYISEVLPRVIFALPVCSGPKSTLGGTSARTPDGWCTVFSAGLDSLGGHDCTPFSPKIPKKCPKWGYPCFLTPLSGTLQDFGVTPPNKSHVTIIVFDSFDPKRDLY